MKNKKIIMVSIVVLVILWALFSNIINNPIYLPKVTEIVKEILRIVLEEDFIWAVSSTIIRTFISFGIALIIAIIIGVLGATNKYIYNFIYPIMAILKSIPTIAFIVIILIWMNKDIAPICIGVVIALPLLYEVVTNSILNFNRDLIDMAKVYRVNKIDKIKNIYIPSIYFNIMDISNSIISLVLKVIIAGEVYGQPIYGIGSYIQLEKINLNTVGIFAWIIIVGVITVVFDYIYATIKKINFF